MSLGPITSILGYTRGGRTSPLLVEFTLYCHVQYITKSKIYKANVYVEVDKK